MKKIFFALSLILFVAGQALAGGVVVFTIDDGDSSALVVAETLMGYGYTATLGVITSRVGTPGYLTVADIQNLSSNGFEVANHTVSHQYFTGMTDVAMLASIESASDAIASWGLPRPTALIPPGGDFGEGEGNISGTRLQNLLAVTSIKVCRQAYPQNLADLETIVNRTENFDPIRVKVFSLRKATVGGDPMAIPDVFYDLIFQVREEGAMVVFVLHRVGDDVTDEYSIPVGMLERMANYISRQTGVEVLNLTEATRKMLAEKPEPDENTDTDNDTDTPDEHHDYDHNGGGGGGGGGCFVSTIQ